MHSPERADDLPLHLLVLRCQAGDERAFARLFDRFAGRTRRYLTGLLGEDAEDVQQEVWLAVYRGIHGLGKPGAFRTWLFQTTRHRAIDHLRKRKRERELLDTATLELTPGQADGPGIDDLEPSGLDAILAHLPPAQREVLLLRYRDDLSYGEIALIVGCSVGTVKSRLHHAKQRVHDLKGGLER